MNIFKLHFQCSLQWSFKHPYLQPIWKFEHSIIHLPYQQVSMPTLNQPFLTTLMGNKELIASYVGELNGGFVIELWKLLI